MIGAIIDESLTLKYPQSKPAKKIGIVAMMLNGMSNSGIKTNI